MHRRVDQHDVGPFGAQTVGGALTVMRGTVVDDDEHPLGRTVGLPDHDPRNQSLERHDPGLRFATAEQRRPMHVLAAM